MFAVPAKIRKRRAKRHANSTPSLPNNRGANNAISCNFENGRGVCECCWNHVSSNNASKREIALDRNDGNGKQENFTANQR